MKVTANKPKNQRIYKSMKFKHNDFGKIKRPLWIEPVDKNYWFNPCENEWLSNPDNYSGLTTSYYSMGYTGLKDVYSIKAAKRLINKFKAPSGLWFRVSLPWVGHEFYIKKL